MNVKFQVLYGPPAIHNRTTTCTCLIHLIHSPIVSLKNYVFIFLPLNLTTLYLLSIYFFTLFSMFLFPNLNLMKDNCATTKFSKPIKNSLLHNLTFSVSVMFGTLAKACITKTHNPVSGSILQWQYFRIKICII